MCLSNPVSTRVTNPLFQNSYSTLRYKTHTHTQPFNCPWSGTTKVGRYQKKHSPTNTHPDEQTSTYTTPPSAMIHSILCIQFTCLTVLFHNLPPGPLWFTSWSGTPCFILHAFLHPIKTQWSEIQSYMIHTGYGLTRLVYDLLIAASTICNLPSFLLLMAMFLSDSYRIIHIYSTQMLTYNTYI